jgi:deoxyribonuclease IV
MAGLLFGTGGNPHSSHASSSISGIERISELGLGCMELEFVQGVHMGEATARLVAEARSRTGIRLSAHAPYYANLNAREPEKIEASKKRILQTARIASICGAEDIVFHSAFLMGDDADKAYTTVKNGLKDVLSVIKSEQLNVRLRPEVMGKTTQFGSLEELLNLCAELEGLLPCIDFAHWHARDGKSNSYPEFISALDQVEKKLGRKALDSIHIHLSGIAYSAKGERNHLNLSDSDMKYRDLLKALKDRSVKGMVICESPNLEDDALLLHKTYQSL